MPSFRILTLEELELLKPEFVQFLAANGISGNDWDKWRIDNPNKREEWVGRFSEYVFFSIIQKAKYWQIRLESGVQIVQILEDTFRFLWFKNKIRNADHAEEGMRNPENMEVYTRVKEIDKIKKNQDLQHLFDQGFIPVKAVENDEMNKLFHTYFKDQISETSQNFL